MGFQNDKVDIFEQLGVFTVISGLDALTSGNSIGSINDQSKNLLPFFLDLLKASCLNNAKTVKDRVRCEINRILIGILVDFLPVLIKIIKEGIVEAIKSGLLCGTDFTIPNPAPTVTLPINRLDLTGMMKIDPNGPGGLLFGDPSRDFNRFLLDIVSNSGNGTWTDSSGEPLLDVSSDGLLITLTVSDNKVGTSFQDYIVSYINSVELFSLKNITANIMDFIFGSISQSLNLSTETISDKLKMDASVDKIMDTDPNDPNLIIDDSFFEFTDDELLAIQQKSDDLSRGVNVVDLGCGLLETTISDKVLEDISKLDVGTPKEVKDTLELVFKTVGEDLSETGGEKEGRTMKAGFDLNAILSIPKILMRMIITPKIISVYQVSNKVVNDTYLNVSSGFDFSKAAKTFFEYVVRESLAALLEILFNIIKRQILALIASVIVTIIKEKIKLFIGSITSITNAGPVGGLVNNAVDSIGPPDTSNLI